MTKSCPLDRRRCVKRDEYRQEANCAEVGYILLTDLWFGTPSIEKLGSSTTYGW